MKQRIGPKDKKRNSKPFTEFLGVVKLRGLEKNSFQIGRCAIDILFYPNNGIL